MDFQAHLPYNHLGDVLFIIHHISQIILMEGHDLFDKIDHFLRPYGVVNKKINDGKVNISSICMKHFDVNKFAEFCAKASSLVLLLRLKFFLRKAYIGITAIRLQSYTPSEKERTTDRGISKPTCITKFNSDIESAFKDDNVTFDIESLMRLYTEFRTLLILNNNFTEMLNEACLN